MARNKPYSGAALLTMLIALAIGVVAGCAGGRPVTVPDPLPLDLTTVSPCPGESGPGMNGPVPCVWDSETRGEHPGGSPMRWYLYDQACPVATVQPAAQVQCTGRADWTGGVEGEGRTN